LAGAAKLTFHSKFSIKVLSRCVPQQGPSKSADLSVIITDRNSLIWPNHLTLGLIVIGCGDLLTAVNLAWFGSYASVALGMMVSGAGTGLLNGETTKAMIGAVPPERAGMAGGLTGTTRFVGIVASIAVLGAVLAAGTEHHVRDRLEALGAHWSTDDVHAFALRAVAGHGSIANTRGPATDALAALCRASFAGGFVWLLLVAGVVALMAAGLGYAFVRADETTADLPLNRSTRLISSAGVGRP
jgi:hypothetical protein